MTLASETDRIGEAVPTANDGESDNKNEEGDDSHVVYSPWCHWVMSHYEWSNQSEKSMIGEYVYVTNLLSWWNDRMPLHVDLIEPEARTEQQSSIMMSAYEYADV